MLTGVMSSPMFFFFNDTATTEIYTLSLHDALPISATVRAAHIALVVPIVSVLFVRAFVPGAAEFYATFGGELVDRKSTRLNSSHTVISYAVFCLKKKNMATVEEPRMLGVSAIHVVP